MNVIRNDLQTWKRFVREGVLDEARIQKRVAASWHRCKQADVNPYLEKGPNVLPAENLERQAEKHALFLAASMPYAEKIKQAMQEMEMMVLLIDADGVVHSVDGHLRTINEAKRINFLKGARWTETAVGTNAIGTALYTKEPVVIHSSEHYSLASHQWSCSAAPIRYEDGRLAGVIDISCPAACAQPFMLGIAASIAYSAERELALKTKMKELEMINQFAGLAQSHDPIVLCNEHSRIIGASRPVQNFIGEQLSELEEQGFHIKQAVQEENGCTCFYLSKNEKKPAFVFKGAAGKSRSSRSMLRQLELVAQTDATVCLTGETGTGKEVAARAIHDNSSRKNGPFVAVNCGAIPEKLIESELFGYTEGAFTGAKRKGHKGALLKADKGTLFLDEIGEITHAMQVALLRVLQERKVTPVGGTKEIPVDIRIITATHADLTQLVKNKKLREDLFYRLHVCPIHLPPLRERTDDIPGLFYQFKKNSNWAGELPQEFLDILKSREWPGNIRELFNVFERLSVMFPDGRLSSRPLSSLLEASGLAPAQQSSDSGKAPTSAIREHIQKNIIINALESAKGNVTLAAKMAGIPRSTFYKRLKRFKLSAGQC
ncbi:sigma-54-dependent Fis family transcriptional regulator [Bacillus nakamurai]|uniref:Acetoin dehydrogenase n=1 Tax=Bacillus nakamurai TaxID=1793963 RepID=A0A150FBQ9_9BACI|nr:sigma-54-dependent Fis family transcriptional regulator [Bacillus nakamurai]KXZ22747.1 acetoin dehydrogenase [Bacillus nakamurai]MED1226224.1 sigma-54-dependent Fis family transcriptional regulator [Bacillus nakamurai]